MAVLLRRGKLRRFFRRTARANRRIRKDDPNAVRTEFPEHVDWGIWRIVHGGLATLGELAAVWSFEDVMTAHDLLDTIDAAEYEARKKAEES